MKEIEARIAAIEQRNRQVELDKAWETSLVRRGGIIVLTYVVVGLYFVFLGVERPWLNAVVPVLGFGLSTLALGTIKQFWLKSK